MKIYIQIGSNIGNDSFYKMVEQLKEKSRIILVEPNPKLKNKLSDRYQKLANNHDVVICTSGISTVDGEAEFYLYYAHQLSSLIKRRTIEEGPSGTIKIKIITFKTLCDSLNIKDVDHLSIDTEGLDYQILMSIDLNERNISEIIFEEWWPEQDDINGIYDTGPKLLEKVKEKYKDYNWERVVIGNMQNFKLTKK